ncbi:MAG: DNA-binding protein HU 1 [bacterium ADurb.Bin243]|nr:MAG: DNA-binding protein HU 1 [bacterium ADurb.Bin243]HOD42060.1 HU family DNA-binding protein [Candidatus Wallbacteria bacterium]
MNKTELLKEVAKKAELTFKDAQKGLDTTLQVIKDTLKKGGKITLVGFGTFSIYTRKGRNGRNPQTGKTMKIAPKTVAKFKAGKMLSDLVVKTKKK